MLGRDKTKKDPYMVKTLLNMFKRKQINKNHPLQRKPDQWSSEAKSGLVASVIKQEDLDSIKICEQIISEDKFILWLIDGLQRLTVLDDYRHNGFKIGRSLEMPFTYFQKENTDGDLETIEYDLRGKYFKDLPEELQDSFDSFAIDVVKHLDCSDEEVAYHIGRYNRQTSMNTNQKNILSMHKVAEFIKEISDNNIFFKECGNYKENEIKKGVIDTVILQSIMTMFHFEKWSNGKVMSKFLNENATQEEFEIFKSELNRLSKFVNKETTGKLFNSKNSFIWFTVFHEFDKYGLDDLEFEKFLDEFQANLHNKTFEDYDNESFISYDYNNRNTKDKKVVTAKIDMLNKLLKEFLDIEDEIDITTEEFISEVVDISLENVQQDMSLYKETLLDLETRSIKDGSKLLEQNNEKSLLAMVAYSFKNEVDLEKWLGDYARENDRYILNQKKNYEKMLNSYNEFMKGDK